jgi:hypothetical protein
LFTGLLLKLCIKIKTKNQSIKGDHPPCLGENIAIKKYSAIQTVGGLELGEEPEGSSSSGKQGFTGLFQL